MMCFIGLPLMQVATTAGSTVLLHTTNLISPQECKMECLEACTCPTQECVIMYTQASWEAENSCLAAQKVERMLQPMECSAEVA